MPNVVEPAVEVSIRKAWLYCKDSVKDPKAEEKKEFDPNECTTLDAAWDYKYSIKLTTRERVGKHLMKRLHSIAHSHPPDFDIVLHVCYKNTLGVSPLALNADYYPVRTATQ